MAKIASRAQPPASPANVNDHLPPAAAAGAWTAATYRLIGDFERDLKACVGAQACVAPTFIVMASDCLWHFHGPAACWSKLDLEHLRVLFAGLFRLPGLEERMAVELMAFYTFLAKSGHVEPEVTLRIHQALGALAEAALGATLSSRTEPGPHRDYGAARRARPAGAVPARRMHGSRRR